MGWQQSEHLQGQAWKPQQPTDVDERLQAPYEPARSRGNPADGRQNAPANVCTQTPRPADAHQRKRSPAAEIITVSADAPTG
jgi:hypothetical protein